MRILQIIGLLFLLSVLEIKAQGITISEFKDNEVASLLTSIRDSREFHSDRIVIHLVESAYVTAREIPGLQGDLIVYKLFISVQELTEEDKLITRYYWVDGNFYNPRNYKFDPTTKKLTLQHGSNEQPTMTSLLITPSGLIAK